MEQKVLAIVSHPDDAEFLCAGTLALLQKKGWEVYIATMTAGDCGSKFLSREDISDLRKVEATKAASLINANYACLGFNDFSITYARDSIHQVTAHIRKVKPDMVFTMSPDCYMLDHEITSLLVQTGCFASGVVNFPTPGIEPHGLIPHLYYLDPIEGKDKFGTKILPTTIVDISSVIDLKAEMLSCHRSQRDWLREQHGMDEYIHFMKRQSSQTGKLVGVSFAEGFRQHLGHSYPQSNKLKAALGNLVNSTPS